MQVRRLLPVVVLMLASAEAHAQRWWVSAAYSMAQPASNTAAFSDGLSLRGAIVDVRRSIQRHITIGVSLGWQVFSEETRDAGAVGGAAARTLLRRHTNAFPLLASAHYRAGPPGWPARPFVGLHVGTVVIERRLETRRFAVAETSAHLGLAADAGVAILVSPALAGLFGARYHFAREAAFTADQTYWSVYFGIALVR